MKRKVDTQMAGVSKSSKLNSVNLLIAGMNKNFTAKNSLLIGGTSMTQVQILAQLAAEVTLIGNVTDTKNAWSAAVAAMKSASAANSSFDANLVAAIKQAFGPSSPLLGSFGIATPKPKAVRSAVEKAVATALAKNTRVVRGTKSAKQKQAITLAGTPGLTVVNSSGEPLLTVGPVAPGSGAPPTVTVAAAVADSPAASTATGPTATAAAPSTGNTPG
jgi:hypothetical protein